MSMKVVRQQLRQVSPQLYKQLHSLNFRHYATMQGRLETQRREKKGVVHYILDGTRLMGWSLFFYDVCTRAYWCHFYIRKSERRKGYGRQLFSANIKYAKRLKRKTFRVSDDTAANRKFFKKVKREVKGKSHAKV